MTYQIESGGSEQFVGRDVVVIGGGDSATLDALELARNGATVKLVHRSNALTARDDIVEQDGDRSRPVGAAVRRDIEPEVEPLRLSAPPRPDQHYNGEQLSNHDSYRTTMRGEQAFTSLL